MLKVKLLNISGITHAAVWAACCSFISHNTDAELRPSMQSFLQGIHHGFGRFCGAVFGGMLIKEHGKVFVARYLSFAKCHSSWRRTC